MTPRTQALAYRIWGYCDPREWDCTYNEIADALDVSVKRVGKVVQLKGWASRLRCPSREAHRLAWCDGSKRGVGGPVLAAFDDMCEGRE
jgi:hypothetical protein